MAELRGCPFCGEPPIFYEKGKMPGGGYALEPLVIGSNKRCLCAEMGPSVKDWNTRPLEDRLSNEVKRLEQENDRLWETLRDAVHDLKAIQHSYGSVVGENPDLPRYEAILFPSKALSPVPNSGTGGAGKGVA